MEKPKLWQFFSLMIIFIILLVVSHELGHYVVADYYGLDPKLKFYDSNYSKNLIMKNIHVAYGNQIPSKEIDQKLDFAGFYFEIIFCTIFYCILLVHLTKKLEPNYLLLGVFILCILAWWLISYNPFIPIKGGDMWQLIYN